MTGPLLVTGGTGLLGSAIRKICPDAIFLSRADGDLRDRSVAQRLLEDIRPRQILHLAGLVGGVKANAANNGNAGYGYAKRMLDFHTRLVANEEGWKTGRLRWGTRPTSTRIVFGLRKPSLPISIDS
jgi:hypothetical protein